MNFTDYVMSIVKLPYHTNPLFQSRYAVRRTSRMNGVVYNRFSGLIRRNKLSSFTLRHCTSKSKDGDNEEPPIPVNPYSNVFSAARQEENGVVYDNKPFKIHLEAGKKYMWCLCGQSKTQPFCDGTHKLQALKITLKPVRFTVTDSKDYWICNCKQTTNRPFCDGSHKEIQMPKPIKP